ncbi:hypothetical protein FRC11_014698 [Ceratobasidium sp. 423]|nr:hypothetical protein FRC11_014698 [Ceratobasidium sp. 423]
MPTTPTNPPPECDSRANTVDTGSTCPTPPVVTNPSRDSRLTRTLRKLLDKSASSLGPLKATVTDLAECIGKCDDMLNGKKEYEALKDELEKIFEMLNQHCNREVSPAVTTSVESLYK